MPANRLIREKSPYLLQHARNPVDWRPWGPEAFAAARKADIPIFLSIGYSTCHWCHVMEKESFENAAIAAKLNANFVCVKVDREERPDVDRAYMSAVQAMTGQGGWPLSVFLTPELKPFFGGTYFPPEPRWGLPAFPALISRVAELWNSRRADLLDDAGRLSRALEAAAAAHPASEGALEAAWLGSALEAYRASFDDQEGGFGSAPKFPSPPNQDFLLAHFRRSGAPEALEMAVKTLRAIVRGGIHDHLGGGFHRYSTDALWRVPHFEKMLYDNAQICLNLLDAGRTAQTDEFAGAARQTLDYLLQDMGRPDGGFYCAEDADSPPPSGGCGKKEGAFYLWTEKDIRSELGEDAELFIDAYGVRPEGNAVWDPHDEFSGQNVLYQVRRPEKSGGRSKQKQQETGRRLAAARKALLARRRSRPRPDRDEKIIVSWNGLAVSALSRGSALLGKPSYLEAAEKTAHFLRGELRDAASGRLFRRWAQGERAIAATAEDYAFLIQGLLDLFCASFEPEWLAWALELQEEQDTLFRDPEGRYYLAPAGGDDAAPFRMKDEADNVLPCASSVAALNSLRLWRLSGIKSWRDRAEETLRAFGRQMKERPLSLPKMLCALSLFLSKPSQLIISGRRESPDFTAMAETARPFSLPETDIILMHEANHQQLARLLPALKPYAPRGEAAAYFCADFSCDLPLKNPQELSLKLKRFGIRS